MRLFEKDAMQQMHWTLEEIDEQEYQELMSVLNADENEKSVDPAEFAKQFM